MYEEHLPTEEETYKKELEDEASGKTYAEKVAEEEGQPKIVSDVISCQFWHLAVKYDTHMSFLMYFFHYHYVFISFCTNVSLGHKRHFWHLSCHFDISDTFQIRKQLHKKGEYETSSIMPFMTYKERKAFVSISNRREKGKKKSIELSKKRFNIARQELEEQKKKENQDMQE